MTLDNKGELCNLFQESPFSEDDFSAPFSVLGVRYGGEFEFISGGGDYLWETDEEAAVRQQQAAAPKQNLQSTTPTVLPKE